MIFVDMTGAKVSSGTDVKFHGGGHYARTVVNLLVESEKTRNLVTVLWPRGYTTTSSEEMQIMNDSRITNLFIDTLDSVKEYESGDTLFIPLVGLFQISRLEKIKRKYPELRVVVTIHGLRYYDLLAYDKYNKFYQSTLNYMKTYIRERLKLPFFYYNMSKLKRVVDGVVTVSNYSLQHILSFSRVEECFVQYQGIGDLTTKFDESKSDQSDYILFVNADRSEKNFIRSFEAYVKAVKLGWTTKKLKVTGVDDSFWASIIRAGIDCLEVRKNVSLLGYVSAQEIRELYKNCYFLLYTSRNEGFGLPLMEAAIYGNPTVASRVTSIPEVLGNASMYVDPFDVDSIARGIAMMSMPSVRKEYSARVRDTMRYLPERVMNDNSALIDFLVTNKQEAQ